MLGERRDGIHLLAPIDIGGGRGIETGGNLLSSLRPDHTAGAMPRKISPECLPDLLRPGMTVFVQGASGQPTPFLDALAGAPEASAGVHYVGCFIPGVNAIDPASFHASARLTSFFIFGEVARSHAAGKVRFLPLHYSGIWDYLAGLEIDLALIQVAPPDSPGRCSLGVSVHFVPAVLERAKAVVAEVNAAMPRPAHSYEVPYERLDHVVETERPLVALATGGLPAESLRIGAHVAELVEDGDTIQIGIGKVPAAVLAALRDRQDLGLHGGLVSDEVADLHEAGVLTGARKSQGPGMMVCTAALGGPRVYDWAGRCPALRFAPVSYTHDVRVLAQLENFVAINSVLAVDLSGQANAEMLDGRQVSGTGGLLDFVRGARLSKGGRSILALPSTVGGGGSSRIVPRLGAGDVVSCPRADADIVVTEHGIARLRDKSIEERAEALIAIADPAFRRDLADAWEALRRKATG
jgi:4-hydroxybutyrate CoA-transferase